MSKQKVVDLEMKVLISESILEDHIGPAKLARQLNMNRKTVERIARKARRGHTFQLVEGRPRAFDEESQSIVDFFRQNQSASKVAKVAELQQQYTKSCIRRGIHVTEKHLSMRSTGRYLKMYEGAYVIGECPP